MSVVPPGVLGTTIDADGVADPQALRQAGVRLARLVLKGTADRMLPIVQRYVSAGLDVLGIVTPETEGHPLEWGAVLHWLRYLQLGNEPDSSGAQSATASADDINVLGQRWNVVFPKERTIGPGLVSGDPAYLDGLNPAFFSAWAIHPYTHTAQSFPGLLAVYRDHARGKPIWVTEFQWDLDLARTVTACVPVALVYCWQSWAAGAISWPFGLLNTSGLPTPALAEFTQLEKELAVPEFKLGFATYAQQHPEVGQPLEDEHYLAGDDHYSLQMTSNGLLVYAKQANQVQFLPALGKA